MEDNRVIHINDIQLREDPLQVQDCVDFVTDQGAGGIAVFIGNVRNITKGKEVRRLEFEAYRPLALSEMTKIAIQLADKYGAIRTCIHHRIGLLKVTDTAVIIAVSTPHRKKAFEACQYAIDTLKETVPIWKKEVFLDGEIWVAAHP